MTYRTATKADIPAVAGLHALSWQHTYRGAFPDYYLDHEVPGERLEVWTNRFAETGTPMQVTIAETASELVGFCCVFLRHSSTDGHLLDNLHVHPDHQGRGIGKHLMQLAAKRLMTDRTEENIFLWVLATNALGLGFYEHLGGRPGRTETHNLPGGTVASALLMSWPVTEIASWNLST